MQSRYYNPELGRFINADILTSTGQGLLGNNMFSYCLNNPVKNADPSGTCGYSVYTGGKGCYRCKNKETPKRKPLRYVTDYITTSASVGAFVMGGPLATGVVNNSVNAVYYKFLSPGVSKLEQDKNLSSYTDSYISRWDRLDHTKQETGDSNYFFNAWRYNSEYSMHMYGWYALLPFKDRGFERIDPYIESLEYVHILSHDNDENPKSRVLTYLFGLLGV